MKRLMVIGLCVLSMSAEARIIQFIETGLRQTALKQVGLMQNQVRMTEKQLSALKHIDNSTSQGFKTLSESVTGHNDYGTLLNHSADKQLRRWSPGRVQELLTGHGGSARFKQTLARESILTLDDREAALAQIDDPYLAKAQDERYAAHMAEKVTSQVTYDRIQDHLARAEQLMAAIDQTENIKAAMDLNTRLQAEQLLLQLEMIKLQSVHGNATAQAEQAVDQAQLVAVKFNQW